MLGGARERFGVALHLEVHADLEQFQRRQLAHRLGARLAREYLERTVEAKRGVGLGRDREPQVERVVAQVVVRHAGMRVDQLGGAVRVLGIDLRRDEHRRIAERARVEDRRDLANDARVEQALNARENLRFLDTRKRRHVLVGARGDRKAPLHEVQELAIEVVERDRRAALAGASLGNRGRGAGAGGAGHDPSLIQRAASFAW